MAAADATTALEAEARAFGRYLVGRVPSPALVARYVAANETLFADAPSPGDAAVVAFARRHPWSAGSLDAAAGLLRPGGLLRSKMLVMAAILEASPETGAEFLPRTVSRPALAARLAVAGAAAVLQAAIGLVLHAVVARSRA